MGIEESAWSIAAPSSAASVMSSASTPRTSASAAQSVAPPAGDEECAVDGSGRRHRPYNFRF